MLGIGLFARLFHDVVERDRLLVEQARFRAIMDEASDGIQIIDAETRRIVEANRKGCELSGYPHAELMGREVREFWPSPAFADGASWADGIAYHGHDGSLLTVDATWREVTYGGGAT